MNESSQLAPQTAVLVAELYHKSGAAAYAVTEFQFAAILSAISAKYLGADANPEETLRLFQSLHLEELVLARACAAGNEYAWEVFLTRYRARLYGMASAIVHDDASGRELADSVYAELYGLHIRGQERVSKLSYYTGRGSLEGWLRTVLAQDFVDRYRSQKRLVSLEERAEEGEQLAAPSPDPGVTADPKLSQATDEALESLPAEDRFILATYFLDERTLAEIARMLRVHESTISRRIDKLTRKLRENIVHRLSAQGLSRRAAEEALETDVRDLAVDVRMLLRPGPVPASTSANMAQGTANTAFPDKGTKT